MIEFALDRKYERSQFMAFLKTFLPDDYVQQEKNVDVNFKTNFIMSAHSLGICKSLGLEVFEVVHSSLNDARVGLSKDAFRLLLDQSYFNCALVVFIPEQGSLWRLSLIQMEADIEEGSSRIQHRYSNPRRYSFLLGEGAHVKTPHQFLFELGKVRERKVKNKVLTPIEDLFSRFSVEALTQQFYDKLYHWYQWAIEKSTGVYFPNRPETTTDDRDAIGSNMIRLVTRLLFVWFIKQKGLVPDSIFDVNELDKILVDFDPESSESSNYYNAILQNLFFATLNSEINKRAFTKPGFQGASSSYGVKTLFRDNKKEKDTFFKISHEEFLKIFLHVPYMNCGLFECLDKYSRSDIGQEQDLLLDGFTTKNCRDKATGHFKYRAFVPNSLFFAPEHKVKVTTQEKGKVKEEEIEVQGLINLLKDYNFTVEENTPAEVQVSLDPELLGRVFENLLAAYNPETGDSVRKSTGSFYTPREIVQYMVNESLVEYLKSHVENGKNLEGEFRKLIEYQDHKVTISEVQKDECLKALYECKVLDPACGSGAFPMGMLQQMVHIIKQLDPQNEKWHQIVLDKAAEESRKAFQNESNETRRKKLQEIDEEFNDDMTNSDYKRKLYIIQNCIYGVDIQPIAMLICKLRFFISLVCEQNKIDFSKPEDNFGINTLPNLETKFVSANTLLSPDISKYTGDWTVDEHLAKLKEELLDIRMRHFKVKTQTSKQNNRDKDEAKRQEILSYIVNSASKPDEDLIKRNKALIKEHFSELNKYLEKKMEPVKVPMSLWGEEKEVMMDMNASKRRELQDRIKSCESEIKREENKKNPVGFEAAVQQVTEWNPYDQNTSAPFFSPEWMFGMTDGFDIVIANPPYLDYRKIPKISKEGTVSFNLMKDSQRPNFFCFFIEKGIGLLKSGGILFFINPESMLSADFAFGLRKLLLSEGKICSIVDVSNFRVFQDAQTYTMVWNFIKNDHCHDCIQLNKCSSYKDLLDFKGIRIPYSLYVEDVKCRIPNSKKAILACKIENNSVNLGSICKMNWGTSSSGYGRLKIKESKFCELDESQKSLYSPLIQTADIKRYVIKWEKSYIPKKIYSESLRNIFEHKKIVVARLTKQIQASIDEEKFFVGKSTVLYDLQDISYEYLVALLNSKLLDFWYKGRFESAHMGSGYIRYDIPYLSLMPIRYDKENLVKAIEKAYLSIKKHDTFEEEKVLDILIFKLYDMSYEEVKYINPNFSLSVDEYNNYKIINE